MTSRSYPKLRACSLATVPLLTENMTKTQVENCVAIDAMTEQTKENNLKHYLRLSLELAYFLTLLNVTAHLHCNFNDCFLRMKDQHQHSY